MPQGMGKAKKKKARIAGVLTLVWVAWFVARGLLTIEFVAKQLHEMHEFLRIILARRPFSQVPPIFWLGSRNDLLFLSVGWHL